MRYLTSALALILSFSVPMYPTDVQEQVEASQAISPRVAVFQFTSETNLGTLAIQLVTAATDDKTHGILFIINHNGGSTADYSVIHDMIRRVKSIKPVVGLIAGSACSMGYFIASATDYLIAHTMSDVGGIGVYQIVERFSDEQYSNGTIKANVKSELFKVGRYKALENRFSADLSEEDRAYIQGMLEELYQVFVENVAKNRDLDLANVQDWAEGRLFAAHVALNLGLIDEIGTVFEAKLKLHELICSKNPDSVMDAEINFVFMNGEKA